MEGEKGYIDRLKETGLELQPVMDKTIMVNFEESVTKHLSATAVATSQKRGRDLVKTLLGQLKALVKTTVGRDKNLIQLALGAYRSSISSFASRSLKDKQIFNYKELNFTDLAKGFGVAKEWASADRTKQAMYQGLDRMTHGRREGEEHGQYRARPEDSRSDQFAQLKVKKMEEMVKKFNRGITKSLDY